MASNDPGLTWVTAQVTGAEKSILQRITELDSMETGMIGNQSATLRRLIRQEAARRNIPFTIEDPRIGAPAELSVAQP